MEIKNKYEHSKIGLFMFNICAKWTRFLCKHRALYYLLSLTWGLIMSLVGFFITAALGIAKIFSKDITFKKYNWVYSISVKPDYWGGFDTGLMFVRDMKSSSSVDAHEFGHTFQNCLLGPLFPFLVAIPSACRWWARELNKKKQWNAYDSAWFEDAASQCGAYANFVLNNKD